MDDCTCKPCAKPEAAPWGGYGPTLGVAFTPRQREVPQDRPTWHKRPPR